MTKRYYELIGKRLVCELNFIKGFTPTKEAAERYLECEVRELTRKEFNKLGEEFGKKEVQ